MNAIACHYAPGWSWTVYPCTLLRYHRTCHHSHPGSGEAKPHTVWQPSPKLSISRDHCMACDSSCPCIEHPRRRASCPLITLPPHTSSAFGCVLLARLWSQGSLESNLDWRLELISIWCGSCCLARLQSQSSLGSDLGWRSELTTTRYDERAFGPPSKPVTSLAHPSPSLPSARAVSEHDLTALHQRSAPDCSR